MNKYKIEEILSNIQFQVYSDMNFIEPLGLDKETWKELLEYINKQKEVLDKIKDDLIKTKKYNKVYEDKYGNKLINIDIDHLDYLLKILEEIE